ncbi:hypothetical protein B6U99_04700 [Candidatus Geothermarchaeota archaeon ex4572_27]|nr:MAG: hypothetical protein B6U99_04700 [Candidatus Geothermarchaeota archaeon ex4572_27]
MEAISAAPGLAHPPRTEVEAMEGVRNMKVIALDRVTKNKYVAYDGRGFFIVEESEIPRLVSNNVVVTDDVELAKRFNLRYLSDSTLQKVYRMRMGLRKSHRNDALIIYKLFLGNPKLFHEPPPPRLIEDELPRELWRLSRKRQKLKDLLTSLRVSLGVQEIPGAEEILKLLCRHIDRLRRRIERRYDHILSHLRQHFNVGAMAISYASYLPRLPTLRRHLGYCGHRGGRKAKEKARKTTAWKIAMNILHSPGFRCRHPKCSHANIIQCKKRLDIELYLACQHYYEEVGMG